MDDGVMGLPPRHNRPGGHVARKASAPMDSLLRAAVEQLPLGMMILDRNKAVRFITGKAAEFLGLRHGTVSDGRQIMPLLSDSHVLDDAALQTLAVLFEAPDDPARREVLLSLPKPGGARVVCLDMRGLGGQGWLISLRELGQAYRSQDMMLARDATDALTGLCNKRHFMTALRDQLDQPADNAVTVIRLSLHRPAAPHLQAAGDAAVLARLVAGRILSCLRAEDVASRFMGDDFAVMVAQPAGRPALTELGTRLTETMSRPYMIEGKLVTAGAHAGVACAPEDGDTAEELVANADLALAAARADQQGKPRFFEPRLDDQARRRRNMEFDLRYALAHGEFVLHYQPQIDVRSRRVRVFEALIRWRSHDRGMVPPNDFIPVAEQTGLIIDIGNWVMREACREAATWPEDIVVAVNASPVQIEAGNFTDMVASALAENGLPAHRLEIEITENLLLAPNSIVNATLLRLRDMGVHLVLDDFGTGYASLSQLARFRFNKIKIDRSLISAPDAVAEHSAIVRAIAALGVSLCVPTTAEGVETAAQFDRVAEDGCTQAQGFYFSRAVPAEAVPALLEKLGAQTQLHHA